MHVHVLAEKGEAKFWIEPVVSLAEYSGLNAKQLRDIEKIVRGHLDEIEKAWKEHFD